MRCPRKSILVECAPCSFSKSPSKSSINCAETPLEITQIRGFLVTRSCKKLRHVSDKTTTAPALPNTKRTTHLVKAELSRKKSIKPPPCKCRRVRRPVPLEIRKNTVSFQKDQPEVTGR